MYPKHRQLPGKFGPKELSWRIPPETWNRLTGKPPSGRCGRLLCIYIYIYTHISLSLYIYIYKSIYTSFVIPVSAKETLIL